MNKDSRLKVLYLDTRATWGIGMDVQGWTDLSYDDTMIHIHLCDCTSYGVLRDRSESLEGLNLGTGMGSMKGLRLWASSGR